MSVDVKTAAEAHYICAALNSSPSRFLVSAYAIEISMDTHILENVGIPAFAKTNHIHTRLSELSESAHKALHKGHTEEVRKIEEEIDRLVAKLWSLSDDEVAEIKQSLEEA